MNSTITLFSATFNTFSVLKLYTKPYVLNEKKDANTSVNILLYGGRLITIYNINN